MKLRGSFFLPWTMSQSHGGARLNDKAETQRKIEMTDQERVLMAFKFFVSTSPRPGTLRSYDDLVKWTKKLLYYLYYFELYFCCSNQSRVKSNARGHSSWSFLALAIANITKAKNRSLAEYSYWECFSPTKYEKPLYMTVKWEFGHFLFYVLLAEKKNHKNQKEINFHVGQKWIKGSS